MTASPTNQIKRLRTEKGLSQAQLAEALGAHWITVSKLERGKSRLTQEWMTKIAQVLQVDVTDLIRQSSNATEIVISGMMTDKEQTIVILENDPSWGVQKLDLELGTFQGDREVWVMIGTNKFYPFIHSGDIVRFTYVSDLDMVEPLVNRLCLVHSGRQGSPLVGFLRWIGKQSVFDLDIPGSQPVRNLEVSDLAGANIIVGRPQLVRLEADGTRQGGRRVK